MKSETYFCTTCMNVSGTGYCEVCGKGARAYLVDKAAQRLAHNEDPNTRHAIPVKEHAVYEDGQYKIVPVLPTDYRSEYPIATGFIDYFPLAAAYVSYVSKVANDQHNGGQEMHWARGKSTDHANTLLRHFVDRGTLDTDKLRHTGKVAWRAMAMLQQELEDAGWGPPGRASVFPEEKK